MIEGIRSIEDVGRIEEMFTERAREAWDSGKFPEAAMHFRLAAEMARATRCPESEYLHSACAEAAENRSLGRTSSSLDRTSSSLGRAS